MAINRKDALSLICVCALALLVLSNVPAKGGTLFSLPSVPWPSRSAPSPVNDVPTDLSERQLPPRHQSYHTYFQDLVRKTYGEFVSRAVYDENALSVVSRSLGKNSAFPPLLTEDTFVWDITKLFLKPVIPDKFQTPADVIVLTKRLISIGIARMHRDASMAQMYDAFLARAPTDVTAFLVFRRSLQRALTAYATYFHTVLQLSIDMMDKPTKMSLGRFLDANGVDPLVLLMTDVHAATDARVVQRVLDDPANALDSLLAERRPLLASQSREISNMYQLEYGLGDFDSQYPPNGKFWNMLRPTASCSTMTRLCEVPDGCRLLCNAEYLLYAGLTKDIRKTHRIIGFGSNNEYDWELSLVRMFQIANGHKSAATTQPPHSIGWLTIFDCTLGVGARAWAPPNLLTQSPIGFGHASKCLDSRFSEKAFSMRDMRTVLKESEDEFVHAQGRTTGNFTGKYISRYTRSPAALAARNASSGAAPKAASDADWDDTASLPRPLPFPAFDALTILKADIEGYEHNVMPEWSRDELRILADTRPDLVARNATEPIPFATTVSKYYTLSLMSNELHRPGHKELMGAQIASALRSHYTMLYSYSLGFIVAGQEKNHADNCCYEFVWVHYRHFARSETWMVVGDAMFSP